MPGSALLPTPGQIRAHHQIIKAGSALTNAQPITAKVPIAGAAKGRLYIKADVPLTIDYYFLRPDGNTRYDTVARAQDALLANTELAADLAFQGEAWLEVVVTPGGNGTLSYADIALEPVVF